MNGEPMQVTVVGAGDVGTGIAVRLADSHELTVVDTDENRLDALASTHDVRTVHGDGRSRSVLEAAGLGEADVLVASTNEDSANVMICGAAGTSTDTRTIARVKRIDLYETWREAEGAFGIDEMLCVNRLAAESIVRAMTLPGTLAVDTFADGQVEMAEFTIAEDAPIANQDVAEADRFASLTFAGVLRGEDVIIPSGETTIEPDDRVVVIGSKSSVSRFARTLADRSALDSDAEVVVAGGGQIGVEVARLLAGRGYQTTVIERNRERASEVASLLPETTVSEGDATSADFLSRTEVGDATAFVAALGDDEHNYLASALGNHLGVSHVASVVEAEEHVPLFEAAGIEIAARPREIVAGEISRVVLNDHAASVTLIENDRAELLELTIDADSELAGTMVSDSDDTFPDGVVIGAIVRGGSLVPPRGGTLIQTGDRVIVFLDSEIVDEVVPRL